MDYAPLISTVDLPKLTPLRLLYVPAGDERPDGLICVPIEAWIDVAKRSQTGFDDLVFWQSEIEALGVGHDAVTVVLDDGRMTEASRVWFILQYFGLPVSVLNGGLPSLNHLPMQAPRGATPLQLSPGAGRVGLKDKLVLRDELENVQVFDARAGAEFRGEDLKGNSRGGHLPGAMNLSHDSLLDGRHLRDAHEIESMLDAAGLSHDLPIVSHCNGGGRAALAAVVAGREDVHAYYLSFADWAADESCVISMVPN
ncbi:MULTISPECIES: sulfurtransferase [Agrobacterium]|nr:MULTISPECIES: rhodanese-like domain-containing protein [Agrobacterium]CUX72084.1 putative Rhodanese family protein [Agrobacterium sp. NCPPB 925]